MKTPPIVSIPSDNGVTSSKTISLTSPERTPPWIAAPKATASSGLIEWSGSFPAHSLTAFWTAGIRVEPPFKITLSISLTLKPASLNALSKAILVFWTKSSVNSSNLARVKSASRWRGPASPAEINGSEMWVDETPDKSFLAFSAASFKRCNAILSLDKSTPFSSLKFWINQSIILLSKSSPPRWVSPLVDNTWKTPSPSCKMETSKVPPPRSYTKTFSSFSSLSRPYAKAEAVGSLIILWTFKPAIFPASLVAWRCASLK